MGYEELDGKLSEIEGPLAILSHEELDPDAIASAYAFMELGKKYEFECDLLSENSPTRPENQSLVNYTGIDIKKLDLEELEEYSHISLVDSNVSMLSKKYQEKVSNELQDKIFSIQDHHPPDEIIKKLEDSDKVYIDVRPDLGAASTILTEYLQNLENSPDSKLATALQYGIASDTGDFTLPNISHEDIEAFNYLLDYIDFDALKKIRGTEYSSETLDILSKVIDNKEVRGTYLVSNGGIIKKEGVFSIPQAADFISKMEGVNTAIVSGVDKDNRQINIAVRSLGPKDSAGEIAIGAFDKYGSAGGHKERAGAQLPLGIFELNIGTDDFEKDVFESINKAAWEAVGKSTEEE